MTNIDAIIAAAFRRVLGFDPTWDADAETWGVND